jgi:hypothetical protein
VRLKMRLNEMLFSRIIASYICNDNINYKPEGRGEGLSNDKGGRLPENSLLTKKNNENEKVH